MCLGGVGNEAHSCRTSCDPAIRNVDAFTAKPPGSGVSYAYVRVVC